MQLQTRHCYEDDSIKVSSLGSTTPSDCSNIVANVEDRLTLDGYFASTVTQLWIAGMSELNNLSYPSISEWAFDNVPNAPDYTTLANLQQ